ncbi:MAG: NAD(P)-binding domain-containing protein [Anaerolineae bacterium]|nr:NAD(P)-binding domain-containing protein [Anaerolineae bacterium]
MYDVIVIGGGQAGLAAGYHLKQIGLKFVILEAGNQPTGSWSHYYESLKLFSPARYSSLPGLRFPGDPEHYPSRNEVIAYLSDYAHHFELPIITQARVQHVSKQEGIFYVMAAGGKQYQAHSIIVATGSFNRPHLPQLPGQETYKGSHLHSASYHQPMPYRNQRIVVVGAGNSAIQIAVELAQVAHVTLTSRTPIKFQRQRMLGRDIHFWLKVTGLDSLPLPITRTTARSISVLDTGQYQAAIRAGKPDYKALFLRFTPDGVIWSDGCHEQIDTVLFATGYEPNVNFLTNLGVVDANGQPQHRAGVGNLEGLYFVGLSGQRSLASATLRGVGADAQYVISHRVRQLEQKRRPRS